MIRLGVPGTGTCPPVPLTGTHDPLTRERHLADPHFTAARPQARVFALPFVVVAAPPAFSLVNYEPGAASEVRRSCRRSRK